MSTAVHSTLADTVRALCERLCEHYQAMAGEPGSRLMTPLDFLVASAKLAEVGDALDGIENEVATVRAAMEEATPTQNAGKEVEPWPSPLPARFRHTSGLTLIDGGRS